MKKHLLTFALVSVMGLTAACGSKEKPQEVQVSVTTKEAQESAETENMMEDELVQAEAVEGEVTGVIEEIKDFKFIVYDEESDTYYDFPIVEGGVDMSGFVVGDTIKVSYNGIISEVDPFQGEVLSVEKIAE
ncbi:MAG: hypothetical protein ACI4VG_05065 [Lachnospiraceae bacterium]